MSRKPLPKHGCFHASYPSTEWREVQCAAAPPVTVPAVAPRLQHGPTIASAPRTVGGGRDFSATVPAGAIATATGGFPIVSGVAGEADATYGANAFSLQLNTNKTPIPCSNPSGCWGWEQFVFRNLPEGQNLSGVYIEYWLFGANPLVDCPGWDYFQAPPNSDLMSGCFFNSPITLVNPIPITYLSNLLLSGSAASSGDIAQLFNSGTEPQIDSMWYDSLINLSQYWNTVEFNVFGALGGSEVVFPTGSTLAVEIGLIAPSFPTCIVDGYTAETNNFTLVVPAGATPQNSCPTFDYSLTGGTTAQIMFMESNGGPATYPIPTANPASSVMATSAQFNGSVDTSGLPTLVWFQYSTNSGAPLGDCISQTLTPAQSVGSGSFSSTVPFATGGPTLNNGATYYYVACAQNGGWPVASSPMSFTTGSPSLPSPPSLNSPAASGVTSSTATLSDTVNPNGFATKAWFQYSTSNDLSCSFPTLTPAQDVGAGTAYASFGFNVTGLSSNTTYYFEACASNAGGEVANVAGTFKTLPPTVPSAAPSVKSVGNGASFTQSFAPGMLMSAFGTDLSTDPNPQTTTAPLPYTSSSGTSVTVNGIPAPLLYISGTQINLQIPYELSPGTATLVVNSAGQSGSTSFIIDSAAPGIFVDAQTGHIVPNESASAGTTIGFFLTGAGQVTPSEATGNVPALGTTPAPDLQLVLTIGGMTVTPVYVGIPSWSVGVLQINFTVPSSLNAGTYPVIVTIGGVASNAGMLTVTAP